MRILLIITALLVVVSCRPGDNWNESKLFDAWTEIKVGDLRSAGYHYIDDWSWYNKVNGDTAFIYQTHFDNDPIFSRLVDIHHWKIQDSLGLKDFVESKGGTLVTPMFRDSNGKQFFVQGKSSGQLFRCRLIPNHLIIEFHYPDLGDNLRSKYRKPTDDGFMVEFEKGPDKRSYQTK